MIFSALKPYRGH